MSTPEQPPRGPRRSNADYRWTMPKVVAFLDALAACGNVAEAARSVGMSRNSAYRLRARLSGTRFAVAFEGARRQGIRARAEASRERMRSRWEGPGLAAIVRHMAAQGDGSRAQGDAVPPQGDSSGRQGDAFRPKVTEVPLDSVTGVTCPPFADGNGRRKPLPRPMEAKD